jgi:signal transduction histidine kinase
MEEKNPRSSVEVAKGLTGPSTAVARIRESDGVARLAQECNHCNQAAVAAAHDLKTPLAILGGYVDLLASAELGPLNQRQAAVLKEMTDNLGRLRCFTEEFLTYYSLSAGTESKLDGLDLNQCIADLCTMWAPQFGRKAVAFYWFPTEGLPLVACDYYKIHHVVSNLLDNALKFTPEGGSVWVQTEGYFWERREKRAACDGEEPRRIRPRTANSARINVSDTGPGIPVDNIQEIFEEFRQVEVNGDKPHGNGLGLTIAKRLVEMHQGKIWVESELGRGSKFSVVLLFGHPEFSAIGTGI